MTKVERNSTPTIAHPINSACRELIQQRVITAFQQEMSESSKPGYHPSYDDFDQYEAGIPGREACNDAHASAAGGSAARAAQSPRASEGTIPLTRRAEGFRGRHIRLASRQGTATFFRQSDRRETEQAKHRPSWAGKTSACTVRPLPAEPVHLHRHQTELLDSKRQEVTVTSCRKSCRAVQFGEGSMVGGLVVVVVTDVPEVHDSHTPHGVSGAHVVHVSHVSQHDDMGSIPWLHHRAPSQSVTHSAATDRCSKQDQPRNSQNLPHNSLLLSIPSAFRRISARQLYPAPDDVQTQRVDFLEQFRTY